MGPRASARLMVPNASAYARVGLLCSVCANAFDAALLPQGIGLRTPVWAGHAKGPQKRAFHLLSGRQDLNLRPPGPQPGALPDCATPRGYELRRSGRRDSNPLLELGRLPCNR